MTKTNDAAPKPRTHFEQIPLEVVKKIAEEDGSTDEEAGTDDVNIEPTSRKSRRQGVPERSSG